MRRYLYVIAILLASLPFSGCVEDKKERERKANEKRLERFYEEEWIKCVNELGIDRCQIIQETGLWKCKRYSSGQSSSMSGCAEDRFSDRLATLPSQPVEKPPRTPEATPPEEQPHE